MLKSNLRNIKISEPVIQQAKDFIKSGIIKKLSIGKKILQFDKEIAAGIYVYALEELGKLLLLQNCKCNDSKYIINYKEEFLSHKKKFEYSFSYLKSKGFEKCIYLYKGSFSSNSFTSSSFTMDLYSNTETRLGIFYMDFIDIKNNIYDYDIMEIPNVDLNMLTNTIYKLEFVIKNLIN